MQPFFTGSYPIQTQTGKPLIMKGLRETVRANRKSGALVLAAFGPFIIARLRFPSRIIMLPTGPLISSIPSCGLKTGPPSLILLFMRNGVYALAQEAA